MIPFLALAGGFLAALFAWGLDTSLAQPLVWAWSVALAAWLTSFLHARWAWRRAAATLGLTIDGGPFRMAGRFGGQAVCISSQVRLTDLFNLRRTRYEVDLGPSFPSSIAAGRRGLREAEAAPGTTGDARFDALGWLKGDPAELLARLDAETRSLLADLMRRERLTIADRRLGYNRRLLARRPQALVRRASELSRLARMLEQDGATLAQRLWRAVTHDPVPSVVHDGLLYLLERCPRSPEALGAAREAMADRDPRIRLAAAAAAGADGEATLATLAADPVRTPDDYRLRALEILARRDAHRLLLEVIPSLLAGGPGPVRTLAARVAGKLGLAELVEDLCRLAPADLEEARARAVSLQRLATESDERIWTAVLHHPNSQYARKAVAALTEAGGPAALIALKAIARQPETAADLRSLALQAATAIQERLGAEAGRLSVAPLHDAQGALSLSAEAKESGQKR